MARGVKVMVDPKGYKELVAQIRNRKTNTGAAGQLQKQLGDALRKEDAGEKLMALAALENDNREARNDILRKYGYLGFDAPYLAFFSMMFSGAVAGSFAQIVAPAALATFTPPVLAVLGIFALPFVSAELLYRKFLREDIALKAHGKIENNVAQAIEALVKNTSPLAFATSPRFDDVMENFPDLKAAFILSSAKEAAVKAAASGPSHAVLLRR